ncbi:cell wall integrity and stress response component 4-like [Pimephales promelas]|uniref:cell wall integrity and stress response component 4-like n=1 Tax=Pimephales promelas TaxID=90988 RepID=UPI00195587B7|nr:cell wall integrity and stress response component 4-like [Pimephales promelas]
MMFKGGAVTIYNKEEDRQKLTEAEMSDQCDLCLLGLIILSSLLTGTSGVDDDDHVFISSGVDVRLSCNNALSDCKSTTWTYSSFRRPVVVGLIELGIKNKDTERHERLSLESDCSLNIKNVTEEDYGLYICQQYENDRQQGTDARVYLHVLHVSVSPSSSSSSSSSQTEISPGHSVTLYCQLYSYSGLSCDDRISPEGFELLWVNQTGVDLKTDSRYQISSSSSSSSSSSPDRCIITLTTTLLNEDNNRVWRCQLTHRNQLQTSVTYTVKYSAPVSSSTLTPDTTTNSLNPGVTTTTSTTVTTLPTANSPNPGVTTTTLTTVTGLATAKSLNPGLVAVIVIVAASFALALILWVIRKKRAGNRRGTGDSVEQTDDVTYTEVAAYSKKQNKKNKVRCDDRVTYASIRGAKAGAQENCSELYASVNKNKPVK